MKKTGAFTLTEMLVSIAVIAILAAMLLPALSATKARARRTVCLNNVRQIDIGIRMYSEDSHDALPGGSATNSLLLFSGYKELMKSNLGLKGASSPQDRIFSCPADLFFPSFLLPTNIYMAAPAYNVPQSLHDQSLLDYSSYVFNGGDNVVRTTGPVTYTWVGLKGRTLTSVKNPARTLLVTEASALVPWSWHDPLPGALQYTDARNMAGFVDGHVDYIKIYWSTNRYADGGLSFADNYNPPAGYDYQWSGD
jgi:prepilin-type N-terminal cleavage/methylation domain-containing protein